MKFISKAVNAGFGSFFILIIFMGIYSSAQICRNYSDFGIPAVIVGTVAAFLGFYGLKKLEEVLKNKIGSNEKLYNKIFLTLPILLLTVQIILALTTECTPRNDLSYICKGAENFVRLGAKHLHDGLPLIHRHYFYVYPNNHMLLLTVIGLYKLEYLITGDVSNVLPVIFNIACLNLSFVLMCKCARMIYPPSKALVCAFKGLMFTPLVTYVNFFYSDSTSMLFVSLAVFLYIRAKHSARFKNKLLLTTLSGSAAAIGFKFKGSAGILLIAFLIDILIHKEKLIKKSKMAAVLIGAFAVLSMCITSFGTEVLKLDKDNLYKYKFPMVHWVMMSADGKGGYNYEDFKYTKSYNGYDNKIQADLDRLNEKISDQGAVGTARHLVDKIGYTWATGSYMAGYYNYTSEFLTGRFFHCFAFILNLILLISVAYGFIGQSRISADALSDSFVLKISFIGITLFLIIWETRCRYLVSFFMLFALI